MFFYPGSFCPPTRGHLHIVKKAIQKYGVKKLIIVCSGANPHKENAFSEEQCRDMWRVYLKKDLALTQVITYKRALDIMTSLPLISLIRGLRGEGDLKQEMETITINHKNMKIDAYYLIFADREFSEFSSTRARKAFFSDDHDELVRMVDPEVARLMGVFHAQNNPK